MGSKAPRQDFKLEDLWDPEAERGVGVQESCVPFLYPEDFALINCLSMFFLYLESLLISPQTLLLSKAVLF